MRCSTRSATIAWCGRKRTGSRRSTARAAVAAAAAHPALGRLRCAASRSEKLLGDRSTSCKEALSPLVQRRAGAADHSCRAASPSRSMRACCSRPAQASLQPGLDGRALRRWRSVLTRRRQRDPGRRPHRQRADRSAQYPVELGAFERRARAPWCACSSRTASSPARLTVIGYAENRPVEANDTPEGVRAIAA